MKDITELLKFLSDRANIIAAVGLTALVVFVIREWEWLEGIPLEWAAPIYLVGIFSAMYFVVGIVQAVWNASEREQVEQRQQAERRELVKKAAANLEHLTTGQGEPLYWMWLNNKKKCSTNREIDELESLVLRGYLFKHYPESRYEPQIYEVEQEVWVAMAEMFDENRLAPRLIKLLEGQKAPWLVDRSRIQ